MLGNVDRIVNRKKQHMHFIIPSFKNIFIGKTPEGSPQNINWESLGSGIMMLFFCISTLFKMSILFVWLGKKNITQLSCKGHQVDNLV